MAKDRNLTLVSGLLSGKGSFCLKTGRYNGKPMGNRVVLI